MWSFEAMKQALRALFVFLFLKHPEEIGEDYVQHAKNALHISFLCFCAFTAAFVHAVVPCLFETTASTCCQKVVALMETRRQLLAQLEQQLEQELEQ